MDKVVHFEIPADDIKRAQDFYKNIFGWQINSIPEMNYHIIHTVEVDEKMMPKEKGAINGGMMKRMIPGEQPVIVIDVPSIDDYLKKIETAGGKTILPKMNIGEFGFYARFTDPEGNVIGLWQNLMK